MKKELLKVLKELKERMDSKLIKMMTNDKLSEHTKEAHGRMTRQNIASLNLLIALLTGEKEEKEEKAKDFINAFAKKETKAQEKARIEKEKDDKLKAQAEEIARLTALLEKRGSN